MSSFKKTAFAGLFWCKQLSTYVRIVKVISKYIGKIYKSNQRPKKMIFQIVIYSW